MKIFAAMTLAFFAAVSTLSATEDPVKDYISNFSFYDGSTTIYSDDRLLRFDMDLNNDGNKEVLLSMARARDGKQGNVWDVYAADAGGYRQIGTATFSADLFYLGQIDELSRYGLVTFSPGGGGEGMVRAYLLDGFALKEVQVAAVTRDKQTRELQGTTVLNKYLGEKATVGSNVPTVIDTAALSEKYGAKVEPTTYRQAVERLQIAQTKSAEHAATPRSQFAPPSASPFYSTTSDTPAATTASPHSAPVMPGRRIWPWLIGIFAALVLGLLVWKTQA